MRKFKVNNKLRGAFGETDLNTGTITINKKMHAAAKKNPKKYGLSKKETTILNTIVHENMHVKHPKMHEKTVRKLTKKKVAHMTPTAKKKAYRPFQYPTKKR